MILEEQIKILESIKNAGNIVMIKFDGERKKNQITVLIDFPHPSKQQLIRFDGENLTSLLDELIKEYEIKYGI